MISNVLERKVFRKTSISYFLISGRIGACQGIINVRFFGKFVFLLPPFWDLSFYLINDVWSTQYSKFCDNNDMKWKPLRQRYSYCWSIVKCKSFSNNSEILTEAVVRRCSVKKMFLKISQNSQENTCAWVSFFNKVAGLACNFIKNKTLAQAFSSESCNVFKNTFFYRTPPVVAFVLMIDKWK